MPSDDGRCNRTIHLFAALHGHTPIGRNHGVWHRHLEVTSDVLTCTISEAQKFVAFVGTLPIKGNMTTEAQKFVALVDTLPINGNMTTEAQKFVALVDTLPINGNMIIFITALQELLIDIVAHAARHGTVAITLESNNDVLCTQ